MQIVSWWVLEEPPEQTGWVGAIYELLPKFFLEELGVLAAFGINIQFMLL